MHVYFVSILKDISNWKNQPKCYLSCIIRKLKSKTSMTGGIREATDTSVQSTLDKQIELNKE